MTLFTIMISHVPPAQRDEQLMDLCEALNAEFPAYYAGQVEKGDHAVALFIDTFKPDTPIPAHLNGWGHGDLTLRLVA